ncbi:MAG: hypothetical protein ABI581_08180 [Sediminibacterium sp.]
MEKSKVNIDPARVGQDVAHYVRERALATGSFITYKENNVIIRENPSTGEKTVLASKQHGRKK